MPSTPVNSTRRWQPSIEVTPNSFAIAETLTAVRKALGELASAPDHEPATHGRHPTLSIGELADRLGVTAATLRNWEEAGILTPQRTPTGHRMYHADDVRDAELAHLLRRRRLSACSSKSRPWSSRFVPPEAPARSQRRWRTGDSG